MTWIHNICAVDRIFWVFPHAYMFSGDYKVQLKPGERYLPSSLSGLYILDDAWLSLTSSPIADLELDELDPEGWVEIC